MLLEGVEMNIQLFLCISLCCIHVHCFWLNDPSPIKRLPPPLPDPTMLPPSSSQLGHESLHVPSESPSSVSNHLSPPGECECVNATKLENTIISTGEHIIMESVGRIHDFCFVDARDNDIKEIKKKLDDIYEKLCKLTDDGDDKDVPWKEIENLLYADCVETAIWSLDRWFRNKKWRQMPMCVRKVLIALSCKMGWRELRKLNAMKRLLEKGKWEDAANKVLETEWAKNNKEVAKEITDKLKSVPK